MNNRKAAFTLIETLIAVTIISVVACLAYGSYVSRRLKAQYYSAVSNVAIIAAAEKAFFLTMGAYVATSDTADTNNRLSIRIHDQAFNNYRVVGGAPFTIVVDGGGATYTFDSNGVRTGCTPGPGTCLP